MAETRNATGLTPEQWDNDFFEEYIQESAFKGVMGTSDNNIIQMKEEFNKGEGTAMTIALVNRLKNGAVLGDDRLEGNEERMQSRSFKFTINQRANAVEIPTMAEYDSAINLREAARSQLSTWAQEDTRDRIIRELFSINNDPASGTTAALSTDYRVDATHPVATEAQKDTWLTNNADRVLFGDAKSNTVAGDHSASLAAITSGMTLGAAELNLMKRMALASRADGKPKIKPIRIGGQNRRFFKVYVGPRAMRDLRADTTIVAAQREVSLEAENNRLFQGGDLIWNGLMICEVDDIYALTGVGDSSGDVEPVALCGAQAIAYGIGERYKTRTKKFDYGRRHGIGIMAVDGIHKVIFGTGNDDTATPVDHGIVTGYFAAASD